MDLASGTCGNKADGPGVTAASQIGGLQYPLPECNQIESSHQLSGHPAKVNVERTKESPGPEGRIGSHHRDDRSGSETSPCTPSGDSACQRISRYWAVRKKVPIEV